MSRVPRQPLIHVISSLVRAGGSRRWLGLSILVLVLVVAIWPPSQRGTSTVHPDGESAAGHAHLETTRASLDGPSSVAATEVTDAATDRSLDAAGLLRDEGRGVYRSTAGLVYTRGSEHGHRLQHVLSHGHDIPDRPGQHGVFRDGRQESIVALIDEAYRQAERNIATRRQQDRERTLLTVDLRREIGYIGGQVGNRRGRPPAYHLRLVLEDHRVITAYPVIP